MVPRGRAAWSSESGGSWAELGWVDDKCQTQGLRWSWCWSTLRVTSIQIPLHLVSPALQLGTQAGNAVLTFSVINHQWLLEPIVTLFSLIPSHNFFFQCSLMTSLMSSPRGICQQ